jgi:subtilisin family serine protease
MSGFSNHGAAVDVYAPGAGIRSAWMSGDGDFRRSSGTSMAAPLVTGCIALYLEKYPDATPEDCQNAVQGEWDEDGGSGG